jgi:pilus assembly protein Flp/PilA
MSRHARQIGAFLKDESWATAIEYGQIADGVSIAIFAVVNGLGSKLRLLRLAGRSR